MIDAKKTQKSRTYVMKQIRTAFPDLFVNRSEEFDGRIGGIWTSGEDGIFNYWNYENRCDAKMQKILDECGWFYEFYDAGTVMLYPN